MNLTYCTACLGQGYQQDMMGFTITNDKEIMDEQFKRMANRPKCYKCNGFGKLKLVALTEEEIINYKNET